MFLDFHSAGACDMSRMDPSIEEIFLQLGASPATRSVKADSLFRRLRAEDEKDIARALMGAPSQIALGALPITPTAKHSDAKGASAHPGAQPMTKTAAQITSPQNDD